MEPRPARYTGSEFHYIASVYILRERHTVRRYHFERESRLISKTDEKTLLHHSAQKRALDALDAGNESPRIVEVIYETCPAIHD